MHSIRFCLLTSVLFLLNASVFAIVQDDPPPAPGSNEVVIEVKGGDRIHGKLVSEDGDSVVVVSPVLGTVTLDRDVIESISADGEAAAEAEALAQAKAKEAEAEKAKVAAEAAEAAKPKSPWSGTVNLGFTYSNASTVTSALNVGGSITKKTDLETFNLNAKYFYAYDDGAVTDNDIVANISDTWYLTKDSPWNYFVQGAYQWDQFQDWEQRFSPYAGVGYALYRLDDLTWNLKFGGGGTWEYTGDRGFDTQFLFETNVDWTIDELQSLTASVRFAPEVSDFSNYLLTVSTNYKLRIGTKSPFSLNLSVLDIYDPKATGDSSTNDLKVVVSLGYDF